MTVPLLRCSSAEVAATAGLSRRRLLSHRRTPALGKVVNAEQFHQASPFLETTTHPSDGDHFSQDLMSRLPLINIDVIVDLTQATWLWHY